MARRQRATNPRMASRRRPHTARVRRVANGFSEQDRLYGFRQAENIINYYGKKTVKHWINGDPMGYAIQSQLDELDHAGTIAEALVELVGGKRANRKRAWQLWSLSSYTDEELLQAKRELEENIQMTKEWRDRDYARLESETSELEKRYISEDLHGYADSIYGDEVHIQQIEEEMRARGMHTSRRATRQTARPVNRARRANRVDDFRRSAPRRSRSASRRKVAQEYNGWFNWDTWAAYGSITADYDDYQKGIRATSSGNPLDLIPVFENSVYREPDVDVNEVDWDEVYFALEEDF